MSFDQSNPAHLATLKTEVETDPLALGYDPDVSTQGLLDLLNAKNYTVSKPKISSAEIRAKTTYQAYNTLAQDEQEWLRWMTGSNGFNEENVEVTPDLRKKLAGVGGNSIWQAGDRRDEMNPIMLAIMDVAGSRAEVLFGYNTVLTRSDWLAARDS